jgi:hypothetical protein
MRKRPRGIDPNFAVGVAEGRTEAFNKLEIL